MLELSLVRLVEIVSEAASWITRAEQARYSAVPWAQVTVMRHRLAHGYDNVDLQVPWDTATDDLPPLIAALERVLSPEAKGVG